LQDELGVTTVYVTHDQIEAMTMGDRVAVMRKGELQQVAAPQELYDRPVNLFVAGFIGSPTMNMMEARVEAEDGGDGLVLTVGEQRLSLGPETLKDHPALEKYVGRTVVLGVRPEDLEDAALAKDAPEDRRFRGKLMLREALGSEIVAHFEMEAPPVLTEDTKELAEDIGTGHHYEAHQKRQSTTSKLVGRFNARTEVREGQTIEVAVDVRALHFFDLDTGLGIYDGEATVGPAGDAADMVGSPNKEADDHEKTEVPTA
jgi:multiple sugar transport system ATP-binding protein